MSALEHFNELRLSNTPEHANDFDAGYRACQRHADAAIAELESDKRGLRACLEATEDCRNEWRDRAEQSTNKGGFTWHVQRPPQS